MEFKVVHGHLFGYCVGVLTVSADALDYCGETGNDVFHMPFSSL